MEMLITRDKEYQLIRTVIAQLGPTRQPSDTCVIAVFPNYSATAAMHIAHGISNKILPFYFLDVPVKDETPHPYIKEAEHLISTLPYKNIILVDSVVNNNDYYDWLLPMLDGKDVKLVALLNDIHGEFICDAIGQFYDSEVESPQFYFDNHNKLC
jgi:hypothetical protein